MVPENLGPNWRINWLKPHLPWNKQAILPAEIADGLCRVMLARENVLEDANYTKIVYNHYVVELSPENYLHHYQPLGDSLLQQWREKLVDCLMTANSRQGRREYRFGGQLRIELHYAPDVIDSQARVLCRVDTTLDPGGGAAPVQPKDRGEEVAYLEWINGDRRWPLFPGDNSIGRDAACDICLDLPLVQEKPLVSAQHAMIHVERGQCFLFDGSLTGKPSANGTYLNSQRIPEHGASLQDGDLIILAALDPHVPRWDTPGVAAFRFRQPQLSANRP